MAGVGLRLNKFFNKKSMSSHIAGAGYSIVITIAPMLLVIVTLIIMQRLLGYTQESYRFFSFFWLLCFRSLNFLQ